MRGSTIWSMPRIWSVAEVQRAAQRRTGAPLEMGRCRKHDPWRGCGGRASRPSRRAVRAGRPVQRERAPMNDPRISAEIPGTSRRQQPILRLDDRIGPQRGSPGNRSGALVGRDNRPLRGSHATVKALGVGLGDFGLAIRRDNGTNRAFFFADAGFGNKIGEMSRMLFRALFPGNNQEEHLVSFIVFPGSRLNPIANNPRPTLIRLLCGFVEHVECRDHDRHHGLGHVLRAAEGRGGAHLRDG